MNRSAPQSPNHVPSTRVSTIGGRVQRDVRLQAALALVVGVALVAVPLFIWGRGKTKAAAPTPSVSASDSIAGDAGPPVVIFGDAGAAVSVDAGGRSITFGEPKYLKCQDPGPGKTPPEKCDHLGPIEEIVTKAIADRAAACAPPLTAPAIVNVVIDVSFKRKKMRVKAGKDGSTMPAAQRTKAIACVEKGIVAPDFDSIQHAHQRYLFQFPTTFGAWPAAGGAGNPSPGAPTTTP
jgi:hypothetical protein